MTLQTRLEEAIGERDLLSHPFYVAWAEGRLSTEDLRFYSTQYWRQVDAFPAYLQVLADRLPQGPARSAVTANLADEIDGDHRGMWRAFATSVGAAAVDLDTTAAEPETLDCVDSFDGAMATAPLEFSLGMLFGYESQTPEVARTKATGLREHYGIDEDGTRYFDEHADIDEGHARDLALAIEAIGGDEATAIAGVRAGAEAVWSLLDGVARVRQIV